MSYTIFAHSIFDKLLLQNKGQTVFKKTSHKRLEGVRG